MRTLLFLPLFSAILQGFDQRVLVPASINGRPVQLVFDTGSSDLVITRRVTASQGLSVTPPSLGAKPATGEVLTGLTAPVRLEMLGQVLADVRLNVLEEFGPADAGVDGFLGWTNVRKNVWQLSGATRQLINLARVPREAATWLQLREVPDRAILTVTLPAKGGAPAALAGIDTGSPYGVQLSPTDWKRWRADHSQLPVTLIAYFMPGAGLIVAEEAWAREIELSGLSLREVPVTAMREFEVSRYPPGTAAVLGLAALWRMDVIFDGISGIVYAHPLTTKASPYLHNRLGAVFVPRVPDADDLSAHVAKGGPADLAGVKDGDVLVRIDDLDVTPWRTKAGILPLSRFGEQPAGTKLRLQLRRAERLITVEIILRDILGPS